MVSPLPPTPWALTPGGDDEIHDVLERYAYYHLEIHQILQILPSKQETQPQVWTSTTEAGHNDSLESIMCRPYRSLHS
jgi:hypothetical protein